jgi:hypothetical protein
MLNSILNKFRDPQTNWKYILIEVILGLIVVFAIPLEVLRVFESFGKKLPQAGQSAQEPQENNKNIETF